MHFPTPSSVLGVETVEELLAFFGYSPVLSAAGFSLWEFEMITPDAA